MNPSRPRNGRDPRSWLRTSALGRLATAARAAWRRVFGFEVFVIQRRPLVADQPIPQAVHATFSFTQLEPADLRPYCADPAFELSHRFLDGAERRGDLCFAVLAGGRLVGYHWQAVTSVAPDDPDIEVSLRYAGHTYGYKMLTHPDYRGRRLQLYCIRYGDTALVRRGYTHTLGYARFDNRASRRLLRRTPGQTAIGWTCRLRLFGLTFAFASPGARQHGFRCKHVPTRQRERAVGQHVGASSTRLR